MKIYSVEVRVTATAYIKAENEDEANRLLRENIGDAALEVSGGGDVEISGLSYGDPDLPRVSLSPAMTVHGLDEGAELEEVEDLDGTGETS